MSLEEASHEVLVLSRYLARDVQSMTGTDLRLVQQTANSAPWTTITNKLRRALISSEMVEVPIIDRWRMPYLRSLLSQRREANSLAWKQLQLSIIVATKYNNSIFANKIIY